MNFKLSFFKKLVILCTFLNFLNVNAQSPAQMSYQAVIRNSTNNLVINQNIGMRISILQGSANGSAVYVETQTPTSNTNGLVSLEIGGGTAVTGTFVNINWSGGSYFIKTETDPTGGGNYTIIGTSQLLSVPYALHATTANRIVNKPEYLFGQIDAKIINSQFMRLIFPPVAPVHGFTSVNNISYNAFTGEIILKAGKTYQLEGSYRAVSQSSGLYSFSWYDKTHNVQFGNYSHTYGHNSPQSSTSQPVFSAIITPTIDITVGIINLDNYDGDMYYGSSYIKIIELR